MLDLIISYINWLIFLLPYIVKRLAFRPPNPPSYRIIKDNQIERRVEPKKVQVQVNVKEKGKENEKEKPKENENENKITYKAISFRTVNYKHEFIPLDDMGTNSLPILIYTPKLYDYQKCIIFCHGNSADIGTCVMDGALLCDKTNNMVVSFEFPGYGYCKGYPTEQGCYKNIQTTFDYLVNIKRINPNKIIVYGFSLGTAIAFDLACNPRYNFSGLVLQSPFLSIVRVLYYLKKTLFFDLFPSIDKAKLIHVPTFIIHGNEDDIVPYIHGRILGYLINEKKYLYDFFTVDEAKHNNLINKCKDVFYEKLQAFFDFLSIKELEKERIGGDNVEGETEGKSGSKEDTIINQNDIEINIDEGETHNINNNNFDSKEKMLKGDKRIKKNGNSSASLTGDQTLNDINDTHLHNNNIGNKIYDDKEQKKDEYNIKLNKINPEGEININLNSKNKYLADCIDFAKNKNEKNNNNFNQKHSNTDDKKNNHHFKCYLNEALDVKNLDKEKKYTETKESCNTNLEKKLELHNSKNFLKENALKSFKSSNSINNISPSIEKSKKFHNISDSEDENNRNI